MKKYIIITALSICSTVSAMDKSEDITIRLTTSDLVYESLTSVTKISEKTTIHLAPSEVLYEGLKKSNREDFAKKTGFHSLVGNRTYSKQDLDELSGDYVSIYYEEYGKQLPEQKITQESKYITQVVIFRSIAYAQHKKFVTTARPSNPKPKLIKSKL